MSYGVGFALLCLLLTGCNDVLFKRYSIRGHSRGMLIFGVGLIWTLASNATQSEDTQEECSFLVLALFGLWLNGFLPKFKIHQSNLITQL